MLRESAIENTQEHAQETYNETQKTSYTKYPNKYIDKIQPTLTKCQAAICSYILRLTYGYHRPFAFISQKQFETHCIKPGTKDKGYSGRQIINGKNFLLSMGLLKKIRKDGKWAYYLDIFYDQPKEKPQAKEIIQSLPFEPLEIPPINEQPESTAGTYFSEMENHVENLTIGEPEAVSPAENSDIASEPKADGIIVSESEKVKKNSYSQSAHNIDTKNMVFLDQDQNKQNKNWKSVCFAFSSAFGINDKRIYETFGKLIAKFGMDYVKSKIEIIKYSQRSNKILNPIGMLISACNRDYIPAKPVRDKLEANAKSEYRMRKAQNCIDSLRTAEAEREDRDNRLEKIKANLPPAKISEYMEKARAAFAGLPFVMERAIEASANDMILADFA